MKKLFEIVKGFFSAPVFDDEEKTRSAKLLYQILTVIWGLTGMLIALALLNPAGRADVIAPAIVIPIILITLMVFTRLGWVKLASYIFTGMVILVFNYADYGNAGSIQPSTLMIAIAIIVSGLLLGRRAPLVAGIIIAISHALIVYLQMQGSINVTSVPVTGFENILITGVMILMIGFLFQFVISRLQFAVDEARKNESELQVSNQELEKIRFSLEQSVAERTKALVTSTEVSRRLSTVVKREELVIQVVEQVQDAFGYYHAHIYLIEEDQLVMAGGTGEAGQKMLASGHKLPIGRGLVGRAAQNNQPVLVADTTQDPNWLPNPLLPDTKSEVAIPIAFGEEVRGVLDVQHNVRDGLSQDDVDSLLSIANQVAIALQNARQFEQTREAIERFELAVAGSNDGVWDWNVVTNEVYYSPRLKEMVGYTDEEFGNDFAVFEEKLHPEDHDMVMQTVGDYLEGKISAYEPEFRFRHKDGSYRWILSRGTAIRNAEGAPLRMAGSHTDTTETRTQLDSSQKQAEYETRLNTITQMIQGADTIEEAMQVAARELGHALGNSQTLVALDPSALTGETVNE